MAGDCALCCLISSIADGFFFFARTFEGEAALLEDADGSGEVREGVGEDCLCCAGGFDPGEHCFGCFESVAAQTVRGEDGVADFGGFGVFGPAEAAAGADEGCRLSGGCAEEDVAVPADLGWVVGKALLEEREDVGLPVCVGPLGGDAAVEDFA